MSWALLALCIPPRGLCAVAFYRDDQLHFCLCTVLRRSPLTIPRTDPLLVSQPWAVVVVVIQCRGGWRCRLFRLSKSCVAYSSSPISITPNARVTTTLERNCRWFCGYETAVSVTDQRWHLTGTIVGRWSATFALIGILSISTTTSRRESEVAQLIMLEQ